VTDNEAEEGPKRKRKKVITRSYKEPPRKQDVQKKPSPKKKPIKSPKKGSPDKKHSDDYSKKSLRKSTAAKSAATQHRLKVRTEAEKNKPKVVKVYEEMPTQEELLEEAAQTEKENILSLEKFRRLELEKKKVRPTKGTTYTGPIIRYHSVSMPIVCDEQKSWEVPQDDQEGENTKRTTRRSRIAASDAAKVAEKTRCERTFITFENDINNKAFEAIFPQPLKKSPRSRICPVTKLEAKYFDPVTQLPYHNSMAFKILRESYYQMLEERADQSEPDVAEWLQWRKKNKNQVKTIKTEQ
jgi:vacuolar protein sorting-associated protein 72